MVEQVLGLDLFVVSNFVSDISVNVQRATRSKMAAEPWQGWQSWSASSSSWTEARGTTAVRKVNRKSNISFTRV